MQSFFLMFEFCSNNIRAQAVIHNRKDVLCGMFWMHFFLKLLPFHIGMSRSKNTSIKFSTVGNSILSTLSIRNLVFHFNKIICSFPSMQRSLHKLSGDGIPDRPSGYCKSHFWDTGCCFSTYCHHCALQGVFTRCHADRQPEEVSP